MTAYETSGFEPPAPIARVALVNLETRADVTGILLLIDTGADATLLPEAAVARIGVSPVAGKTYPMMGFDGSRYDAAAADLALRFLGKTVQGRFLLIEREVGILGRDVLNHFGICLDGPALTWGEMLSLE